MKAKTNPQHFSLHRLLSRSSKQASTLFILASLPTSMGHHHHDHHGHHHEEQHHGYAAPSAYYRPPPSAYPPLAPLPYGYGAPDPYNYAIQPAPYGAPAYPSFDPYQQQQLNHTIADQHRHARNEHVAEAGAVAAGVFALVCSSPSSRVS